MGTRCRALLAVDRSGRAGVPTISCTTSLSATCEQQRTETGRNRSPSIAHCRLVPAQALRFWWGRFLIQHPGCIPSQSYPWRSHECRSDFCGLMEWIGENQVNTNSISVSAPTKLTELFNLLRTSLNSQLNFCNFSHLSGLGQYSGNTLSVDTAKKHTKLVVLAFSSGVFSSRRCAVRILRSHSSTNAKMLLSYSIWNLWKMGLLGSASRAAKNSVFKRSV